MAQFLLRAVNDQAGCLGEFALVGCQVDNSVPILGTQSKVGGIRIGIPNVKVWE